MCNLDLYFLTLGLTKTKLLLNLGLESFVIRALKVENWFYFWRLFKCQYDPRILHCNISQLKPTCSKNHNSNHTSYEQMQFLFSNMKNQMDLCWKSKCIAAIISVFFWHKKANISKKSQNENFYRKFVLKLIKLLTLLGEYQFDFMISNISLLNVVGRKPHIFTNFPHTIFVTWKSNIIYQLPTFKKKR